MKLSIQRMCFVYVYDQGYSFRKEGQILVGQGHGIKWKVCQKEYKCEIWKLYHLPIKSYDQG
jgi:hypothetical protein